MIDFHCHLDLYDDPFAVAEACIQRGVYVLSVTTTPSAWEGTCELERGATRIQTALGLHPQLVHERKEEFALFERLLPSARCVGEIGLDGGSEYRSSWNDQVNLFERALAACRAAGGRTISIHSRRATTAVLDSIAKVSGAGTPILHWYSGSQRDLSRAIDMGCWFSVGPAMLRSAKGRELAEQMPKNRVLTETDGPFARARDGSPLFPWHASDASAILSEIWSSPPDAVEKTIADNLHSLSGA